MGNERTGFGSIDEYIAAQRPEVRPVLSRIREVIHLAVPGASDTIGYQMPAFKLDRPFIFFAAFKAHIGMYPPVRGDSDLIVELGQYLGPKGNLRFPFDQPMPYALIRRLASVLARERSS